jgi:hypothetical protein
VRDLVKSRPSKVDPMYWLGQRIRAWNGMKSHITIAFKKMTD